MKKMMKKRKRMTTMRTMKRWKRARRTRWRPSSTSDDSDGCCRPQQPRTYQSSVACRTDADAGITSGGRNVRRNRAPLCYSTPMCSNRTSMCSVYNRCSQASVLGMMRTPLWPSWSVDD